jgi:hypothetical protein
VQAVRGSPLITLPLTPLQFTGLAGGLGLIAASYCLIHGLVGDDVICLPRTLAWAVASTLPWAGAWEGLKRLSARPAQPLRPLLSAALLIAAFGTCAALEYALSAVYSVDTDSLAQILYRLLPIPLGIAAAARMLQPRAQLPLDTEQVLNIPTRGGMLAVRTCDVQYIKAAGNYVELITADRTLLMRTTLHDLGKQLRAAGFVRVHRSLLVNAQHVLAIRRGPRGRPVVRLRSGVQLPVGRQFEEEARSSQIRAVRPGAIDDEGSCR